MTLFDAFSATKSAAVAVSTISQNNLANQFQYLFDAIQAASSSGQANLIIELDERSHLPNDIPNLVSLLISNGYIVTNVGTRYTITWGIAGGGTVSTIVPITALTPTTITAQTGQLSSTKFTPTGGTGPYTFVITGTVPTGLSFGGLSSVNSITLSGTPSVTANTSISINVTDSFGQTLNQIVKIVITAPLIITTPITSIGPTSFQGQVDILFSAAFIPVGGTGPYSFTVSGNIPNGLSFGETQDVSNLTLTGTPTLAAYDYNTLTIAVQDSLGQTFIQIISLTISPSATGLPANSLGVLKNNGTGVLSWSGVSALTNSSYTAELDSSGNLTLQGPLIIGNGAVAGAYNTSRDLWVLGGSTLGFIQQRITIVGAPGLTQDINLGPGGYGWPSGVYYPSMTNNFTPNLNGVPTTPDSFIGFPTSLTFQFILTQGVTPYKLSGLKINSVTQTIKWLGGVSSGTANHIDVVTLNIIMLNTTSSDGIFTVLGSMSTYN